MTDTARAVRFDRYGGPDVLYVAEIPMPEPRPGEVVVALRAAGINPGEAHIRRGLLQEQFPPVFPAGQGNDLAGVVSAVGPGVDALAIGDEVFGFSWTPSTHATHAAVPAQQVVRRPPGLDWTIAGALFVAGSAAWASVRATLAGKGDTVAVSAAAGGVGALAVQLAARRGAHVLGIASPANADWLTAHGVVPVAHGDGLADRLRDAGPPNVLLDFYGPPYVRTALDLGIKPSRINTVVDHELAMESGAHLAGTADAATPEDLTELGDLAASGELDVPIAATYPLDDVAAAFTELEKGHTRGKIVLLP